MNYDALDLARLQAEAFFVHDANGRLLRINEPEPHAPAPRFFFTRTALGNLWRIRFDLPPELSTELEVLAADEPVSADLALPPQNLAQFRVLLGQHAPVSLVAGPAYQLPALQPSAQALLLTAENAATLQAHFGWLAASPDDYAPAAAVVVDAAAVAVCFSSRITPQVCEAGVYTEAAFRGRGYAAEAVRTWAAAVRASGRLPLYDTSWQNTASQSVARRLGGTPYAANYSLT